MLRNVFNLELARSALAWQNNFNAFSNCQFQNRLLCFV